MDIDVTRYVRSFCWLKATPSLKPQRNFAECSSLRFFINKKFKIFQEALFFFKSHQGKFCKLLIYFWEFGSSDEL